MGIVWERMIRPVLFGLDAERAHEIGIEAMRTGISTLLAPSSDGLRVWQDREIRIEV